MHLRDLSVCMESAPINLHLPLAQKLTDLFQGVIDDLEGVEDASARIEYIKSNRSEFANKMGKIFRDVLKNPNMYVEVPNEPGLEFASGSYLESDDENNFLVTYTPDGYHENEYQASDELIKDKQRLFEAFDQKTQQFIPSKIPSSYKSYIRFNMHCAFIPRDTLTEIAENFTARELTAIMLHEFGHTLNCLEMVYAQTLELTRFETVLRTELDSMPSIQAQAQHLKTTHRKIQSVSKLKNKQIDALIKALPDNVPAAADAHVSERWAQTSRAHLFPPIAILFIAVVGEIARVQTLLMMRYISTKFSDLKQHEDSATLEEQYADRYVTRCGYGADLVTALKKITRIAAATGMGSSTAVGKIMSKLNIAMYHVLSAFPVATRAFELYEADHVRYKSILRETRKVMSASNQLTNAEKIMILRQYDATAGILAKTTHRSATISAIVSFIFAMRSPTNMYSMFTTGNIDKRYAKLVKVIQELSAPKTNVGVTRLQVLNNK